MAPVSFLSVVLPLVTAAVSLVFAGLVLQRYAARRRSLSHLLWGIGLVLYAIGAYTQAHHSLFGFSPGVFRLWYLSGAVLVAAYLGQGTAYLLLRRPWAHGLMAVLALGSIYAAWRVVTAQLDPAAAGGPELTGQVIVTPGVRVLTPFFNIYGTLWLVGGALYSAWYFYRRREAYDRMIGNVLIAAGAMAPAIGGTLNRFGLPGLYVGELVGAVVMYLGFLRTLRPAAAPQPVAAAVPHQTSR